MNPSEIPLVAQYLLEKHGLAQLGWRFAYDHARRRAGQCRHGDKVITLSRHYVDLNIAERLDDVIDTILHEIAHALVGPSHGHDKVWKESCVAVGANPTRCYDSAVVRMPAGRWAATCNGCHKVYRRHRPLRRGRWSYCTKCGPELGRLAYRDTTIITTEPTQPVVDQPPAPRKLR